MDNQVIIAFLFTLFAGVSTGIGSAIAFFAKRTNTSFLSVSLGFSAGVMTYVSFMTKQRNALCYSFVLRRSIHYHVDRSLGTKTREPPRNAKSGRNKYAFGCFRLFTLRIDARRSCYGTRFGNP